MKGLFLVLFFNQNKNLKLFQKRSEFHYRNSLVFPLCCDLSVLEVGFNGEAIVPKNDALKNHQRKLQFRSIKKASSLN